MAPGFDQKLPRCVDRQAILDHPRQGDGVQRMCLLKSRPAFAKFLGAFALLPRDLIRRGMFHRQRRCPAPASSVNPSSFSMATSRLGRRGRRSRHGAIWSLSRGEAPTRRGMSCSLPYFDEGLLHQIGCRIGIAPACKRLTRNGKNAAVEFAEMPVQWLRRSRQARMNRALSTPLLLGVTRAEALNP